MNIPTTAYHYKDIALLPNKSEASSRLYLDPKVEFLGKKFKLPIVPSNMKCVIDENIARWFSLNNYFYIMHRFTNVIDFIKNNQDLPYISISIGVKDQDKDIIDFINESKYRVDVITIDVAHGHSKLVEDMIGYIKQSELKNYKLIAGNICTRDGYLFLKRLGVDAVKVGIGGGCFTSDNKVLTKRGLLPIGDIEVGDEVLTHNNRYKKVIATHISPIDKYEIYKINDIECTSNHEFYVVNKKYSDILNEENIHEYAEWVTAEELTTDYMLIKM